MRPTPDRVRETVFNWLSLYITGSQVLDCFAGAGGLGLEAASREASHVTLVDIDKQITANLKTQCDRLKADAVTIYTGDVLMYLDSVTESFDLVFIDPPYQVPALRDQIISRLIERELLKNGARIYLEWPSDQEMKLNSEKLRWIKQKTAASVCYALAQWGDSG